MTSKAVPRSADQAVDVRTVTDAYGAAWQAHDVDGILAWHAADIQQA